LRLACVFRHLFDQACGDFSEVVVGDVQLKLAARDASDIEQPIGQFGYPISLIAGLRDALSEAARFGADVQTRSSKAS